MNNLSRNDSQSARVYSKNNPACVYMDAFFAAVELLRHPELKGKRVVVGGRGDPTQRGVVSTASYEARKHGIYSWMSLRTAYKLCPEAIFLPVDYACHATPRFLKRSRRACTSSPGESRKSAWTKPFSILAWFQRQYLQLPRCLTQQDIMLAIDL